MESRFYPTRDRVRTTELSPVYIRENYVFAIKWRGNNIIYIHTYTALCMFIYINNMYNVIYSTIVY
jgi:hypothetical protein